MRRFISLNLVIGLAAIRVSAQPAPPTPRSPSVAPRATNTPTTPVPPTTSAPAETPAAPIIVPPTIVSDATVAYPDVAEAQRVEVTVVLELTIGTDGKATDLKVIAAADAVFEQLALDAAAQMIFTPAMRDGIPVPARIQFRRVFKPPQPEPATPTTVSTTTSFAQPPVNLPAPAQPSPTTVEDIAVEVTVEGKMNRLDQLQQSADAVTVVRLEKAKQRSSDMGEVLARTPGVVIRRSGGLGSESRISLSGLYDEAVQVFVDGVPLWMSGYPSNLTTIPVNVMSHVEIYNGVVPLRLSADALGGAINFVTDATYENAAGASIQTGSFGMYRASGFAQQRNEETGFVARATGFFDSARNNYEIDVEVPDARGRLSDATVERFHDRYRAFVYSAEMGYVERPWAERLILKAFYEQSYNEYQHNLVMTVPYGEVNYSDRSATAQLLYEQPLTETLRLQAVGVATHRLYHFSDESKWVYDWFGEQVRERRIAGEIENTPSNQTLWMNGVFGRGLLNWSPSLEHSLQLASTGTFTTQTGDERRQSDPEARDPLTALAQMQRVVSGVGHEWHALPYDDQPAPNSSSDFAFENVFSIKHYYYATQAEQPLPGNVFRRRDITRTFWGISEGVRYGLTRFLFLKGSYEYATRLPNPYEVFGDGGFIQPNIELTPEGSHNINVGVLLDAKDTATGDWVGQVTAVHRGTRNQIVLLGNDRYFKHQNIYTTGNKSLQGNFDWTSPSNHLQFTIGGELIDARNTSAEGTFAPFNGDKTPNRPDRSLSWGSRVTFTDIRDPRDELELFYQGRYTGGFFRGWESQGLPEFKQKVVPQTNHDVGVVYSWRTTFGRFSGSAEAQNVLDAKLFDNYGQQRPGRAFYIKVLATL